MRPYFDLSKCGMGEGKPRFRFLSAAFRFCCKPGGEASFGHRAGQGRGRLQLPPSPGRCRPPPLPGAPGPPAGGRLPGARGRPSASRAGVVGSGGRGFCPPGVSPAFAFAQALRATGSRNSQLLCPLPFVLKSGVSRRLPRSTKREGCLSVPVLDVVVVLGTEKHVQAVVPRFLRQAGGRASAGRFGLSRGATSPALPKRGRGGRGRGFSLRAYPLAGLLGRGHRLGPGTCQTRPTEPRRPVGSHARLPARQAEQDGGEQQG